MDCLSRRSVCCSSVDTLCGLACTVTKNRKIAAPKHWQIDMNHHLRWWLLHTADTVQLESIDKRRMWEKSEKIWNTRAWWTKFFFFFPEKGAAYNRDSRFFISVYSCVAVHLISIIVITSFLSGQETVADKNANAEADRQCDTGITAAGRVEDERIGKKSTWAADG